MTTAEKAKHTPGPWQPALKLGLPIVEAENGKSIASITGFTLGELRSDKADAVREEAAANCNLIAAAPEMLEALERVAKFLRELWDGAIMPANECDVYEDAVAAIRKARGEV